MCFSFFLPSRPAFCQLSLIRGLRLAECGCSQSFIDALLPPSFFLSLSLSGCCPFPAYNDGAQERKNIRCTKEKYFIQDDLEESTERKACQFKRSWLGDCSGLQDPHYGYSQGKPCILLRMNRVSRASADKRPNNSACVGRGWAVGCSSCSFLAG